MKRILVVNSYSYMCEKAVNITRNLYPGQKIDVLFTGRHRDLADEIDVSGRKIHLETESFNMSKLSKKRLRQLRNKEYDTVLILYRNGNSADYLNVEEFAVALRPQRILGIDRELNFQSVDQLSFLVKRRKKGRMRLVLSATLGFFGLVAFPLVLGSFWIRKSILCRE